MGCHSQWGKPSSFSLFDALKLYVKEDVKKEEVGVMVAFLASCPDPVVVSSSHLGVLTCLPLSQQEELLQLVHELLIDSALIGTLCWHALFSDKQNIFHFFSNSPCGLLVLRLFCKIVRHASGHKNNKINFLCHRWHYTDCPLMCVCYTTRQWVLDKQLILICLLRAHCKCSTSDGGRKTQFFSYVSPGLFLYNLINEWHNDDAAS